jgi:hypothetical protein
MVISTYEEKTMSKKRRSHSLQFKAKAANHRKLRQSNAAVVSVVGKRRSQVPSGVNQEDERE